MESDIASHHLFTFPPLNTVSIQHQYASFKARYTTEVYSQTPITPFLIPIIMLHSTNELIFNREHMWVAVTKPTNNMPLESCFVSLSFVTHYVLCYLVTYLGYWLVGGLYRAVLKNYSIQFLTHLNTFLNYNNLSLFKYVHLHYYVCLRQFHSDFLSKKW